MNDLISPIPWLALGASALAAFAITAISTPKILQWAHLHHKLDLPGGRHIHTRPVPRLGGIAIFAGIILTAIVTLGVSPGLAGFYAGLTLLFIIGWLDDLYGLSSAIKFTAQILAAAILIVCGVTISNITNPLGGNILLPPIVDVLVTMFWVVLVVNTVNLLDGLDGLAGSISATGSLVLALLSLTVIVNQPDTSQLASIVLGASLGFLIYNWHPAKIFMGDSGSHVLGFALAGISIISGGKLATAALVLGLPIIDAVWSVLRRVSAGQPPWAADRNHLHHRLMARGFSQPQVVTIITCISILLGMIAVASGTKVKAVAFAIAILVMVALLRLKR